MSRALVLSVMTAFCTTAVLAEEVESKWRLSLALGGFNTQDEIESNASNQFTVINREVFESGTSLDDPVEAAFLDPRNDSSVFGDLGVGSGTLGTFAVQYALTKTFIVEGSVGYQTSNLGDIEVSAQFDGSQPPIPEVAFAFDTFRLDAGEIERIPIQLDGLFRFRPRAKFNPYFGAGIGYAVVGYQPSDEIDQLSVRLDSSIARQCRLTSSLGATPTLDCSSGAARDLQGATVEAGDSFEWNLAGGAEYSFKRNMAAFVDIRWVDASREIEIKFDGRSEVGVSVPQLVDFDTSPAAQTIYGGVQISTGGLIDDGVLWRLPLPTVPINTTGCQDPFSAQCIAFCTTNTAQCFINFISSPGAGQTLISPTTGEVYVDQDPGDGDGRTDPGIYYVQGGSVSFDGLSLQLGFRYTF